MSLRHPAVSLVRGKTGLNTLMWFQKTKKKQTHRTTSRPTNKRTEDTNAPYLGHSAFWKRTREAPRLGGRAWKPRNPRAQTKPRQTSVLADLRSTSEKRGCSAGPAGSCRSHAACGSRPAARFLEQEEPKRCVGPAQRKMYPRAQGWPRRHANNTVS